MIENNIYELMSTSEIQHFSESDDYDFVINLEVLNGCAHSCPGCFVNRKNQYTALDLENAYEIALNLSNSGLRFRELIISPTDIFSATNSFELLNDPNFQKLLTLNDKTRITTTAMFENTDIETIESVFKILDGPGYRSDMILELLIPMNIPKVLNRDSKYYEHHKNAIDFIKSSTSKVVDWSFVINVYDHDLINQNFEEITQIVKQEFDGVIEFLPSFFRTGNNDRIIEHLDTWKTFLRDTVNTENYKDIMLTIADLNHNAMNTLVLNYKKGDLYISPFIYEQIILNTDSMKISTGIESQNIFDKNSELIINQYSYVDKTTDCRDCQYLSTCVGRNVLSFMEEKDITECIYPRDILGIYLDSYDGPIESNRISRCNDNSK